MDNVIEFSFSAHGDQAQVSCWLCQKGTNNRALFCAHCGSIQPARPMDHFMRLGLERRIDIDSDLLERQYASLRKALDPERFAIRGLGERNHAARQLEAVEEAYETLREPIRRGRYWLSLHEREIEEAEAANPMIMELRAELEKAVAPAQCDRIAQKAGNAMEQGVVSLMQALRGQNWQLANAILLEVDGLETLLNDLREQRSVLAPQDGAKGEELTTVK